MRDGNAGVESRRTPNSEAAASEYYSGGTETHCEVLMSHSGWSRRLSEEKHQVTNRLPGSLVLFKTVLNSVPTSLSPFPCGLRGQPNPDHYQGVLVTPKSLCLQALCTKSEGYNRW